MTTTRCIRVGLLGSLALLGFLAAPPRAAANEARERFLRGEEAYARGDFETAIAEWEGAYARDPRPRLLYNLAQAYERVGRLQDAARALEGYLEAASTDDAMAERAKARLGFIRARIERTSIRLVGGMAEAEVFLDGGRVGVLPLPDPLPVAPGEHHVEVRSEGARFATRVMVPEGQTLEVPIVLTATAVPEKEQTAPRRDLRPWVFIGAGAGAALTAGILGTFAVVRAKELPSPDAPGADRAHALAVSADVVGAVGLAAISVGAILFFFRKGGKEESAAAADLAIHPVAAPSFAGLTASGRFD